MKIELLEIKNIGGISSLLIDNFDPKINIICGKNGIGKTNILDSIATFFSPTIENIYLNVKSGLEKGDIKILIDKKIYKREITKLYTNLTGYSHDEVWIKKDNESYQGFESEKQKLIYKKILYLKTERNFNYQEESSIQADPSEQRREIENFKGINKKEIKQWFISRKLHSAHPDHLTTIQQKNFELAKACFSLLDRDFIFSKITTKNEIIINTPTGEIYFELLSSGFKSTLFILLGIIKEIEYRFQSDNILASNFDGVILIDEIELHLHPEWQGKICSILTKTFPQAQFIVSTHSPHVIQTAEINQVIALSGKNGHLEKSTVDIALYGFKGWTIEEILSDVMKMNDLRTKIYREAKNKFDNALDENNIEAATEAYKKLDKLLHPQYALRPLFKMQLDSLKD